MDGATLQAKIYAGYAKAAQRIGLPYDVFRPTSTDDPLSGVNWVANVNAAFTIHSASQFAFDKPSDHKNSLYHCLADGSQLQIGDFLTNEAADGTFFIASMDAAVPIFAIECNNVLSAWNPGPSLSIGANGYSGTNPGNETAILTAWPASVLLGSRATRDQQLPEDAGFGSWRIMMSAYPGVVIRPGTILTDDQNRRMVVQVAELQDLGWRIDATQAVT